MGYLIVPCRFQPQLDHANNSVIRVVSFDRVVDIERIKVDKRQTFDTLISEEALLFGKYLRNERKDWIPTIVSN